MQKEKLLLDRKELKVSITFLLVGSLTCYFQGIKRKQQAKRQRKREKRIKKQNRGRRDSTESSPSVVVELRLLEFPSKCTVCLSFASFFSFSS